jgi:4a-hydroxytetrahydrobiopterin dehydratase
MLRASGADAEGLDCNDVACRKKNNWNFRIHSVWARLSEGRLDMARGKLELGEIAERLHEIPGWQLQESTLYREFKFRDFAQAFAFMTAVAIKAQALDHHPDWQNVYNQVRISLSSHDVQGISERDFKLAAEINELASWSGSQ